MARVYEGTTLHPDHTPHPAAAALATGPHGGGARGSPKASARKFRGNARRAVRRLQPWRMKPRFIQYIPTWGYYGCIYIIIYSVYIYIYIYSEHLAVRIRKSLRQSLRIVSQWYLGSALRIAGSDVKRMHLELEGHIIAKHNSMCKRILSVRNTYKTILKPFFSST